MVSLLNRFCNLRVGSSSPAQVQSLMTTLVQTSVPKDFGAVIAEGHFLSKDLQSNHPELS